ncbi:sodium-coupled monocarboxylate transporter 1-like [Saccoglossus kowalevskii]|uniref:Sodium-coupled monocarboxylate transporter 2-like n=1 Tax=Saccoglossus kowalevskii TaxID=10224 RepID=A0ABM0LUU6_SACKO|nr:PREDICTED: sodium-coupled monocarboxylate transporter 2-like [Saccoglossus kowalevskii]
MYETEVQPLHPFDYIVFISVLVFVTCQGLWHGFRKGGQKSTSEFLVTGRTMKALPVSMSLLVTFMSAISLLGTPAEVYVYGFGYAAYVLGFFWVYPLTAYFFVPVFYALPLTSVYEYMEWRYNYWNRLFSSILYFIMTAFYMAIVMIGPALAFEAVNGVEAWKSVLITGLICTFYTSLGGMKAVIWTDVFLFGVVLVTMILVSVLGTIEAGGIDFVWEFNIDAGRMNIFYFPVDLTERVTFLNAFIGGGMNFLALLISQTGIQRFISTVTVKESKRAVMYNLPMQWVFQPLLYSAGAVTYAYYNNIFTRLEPAYNATFPPNINVTDMYDIWGVEPKYEPTYTSSDQILVYFVNELFGHIAGFQGLFIACIFAGTLSTMSSSLNAMAAVTLQDYVKPWRKWRARKTGQMYENDKIDTIVSKLLTFFYGIIGIFLAILAANMESLVTVSNAVFGTSGGPMTGAFVMGLLYKRSTKWGVLAGMIIGFSMGCWVAIGAIIYSDCLDEVLPIYSLSFMWYSTWSCLVTLVVGVLFSEINRCFSKEERQLSKEIDPALLATFRRPKDWMLNSRYVTHDVEKDEDILIIEGDLHHLHNEPSSTSLAAMVTNEKGMGNGAHEMEIRYRETESLESFDGIVTTGTMNDGTEFTRF